MKSFDQVPGRLELEDGTVFDGILHGSATSTSGEIVFQTGMVGYLESLTDPSYCGQILVLTYPSIGRNYFEWYIFTGNYGSPSINERDSLGLSKWYESNMIHARGLVVSEICDDYSHFASYQSLNFLLCSNGITCISKIDTRALTIKLRDHGMLPWCKNYSLLRNYSRKNLPTDRAKQRNISGWSCSRTFGIKNKLQRGENFSFRRRCQYRHVRLWNKEQSNSMFCLSRSKGNKSDYFCFSVM